MDPSARSRVGAPLTPAECGSLRGAGLGGVALGGVAHGGESQLEGERRRQGDDGLHPVPQPGPPGVGRDEPVAPDASSLEDRLAALDDSPLGRRSQLGHGGLPGWLSKTSGPPGPPNRARKLGSACNARSPCTVFHGSTSSWPASRSRIV